MLARSLSTALVLALSATATGQVCATAMIGMGQPALAGISPVCVGNLPLPLPAAGNPNFAIAAYAPPPIPAGAPAFLVVEVLGPTIALGPGFPLHQPFGTPALLGGIPVAILPAGVSATTPSKPVPLPIPPNAPRFDAFVQTLVVLPATGTIAIADGVFVGT